MTRRSKNRRKLHIHIMNLNTATPKISMCQNINTCAQYNKLKTGGNDPSITKSMRYSQMVNSYKYTTNSKAIYPNKTPLFTNSFSK
jgi:hypothetical protein